MEYECMMDSHSEMLVDSASRMGSESSLDRGSRFDSDSEVDAGSRVSRVDLGSSMDSESGTSTSSVFGPLKSWDEMSPASKWMLLSVLTDQSNFLSAAQKLQIDIKQIQEIKQLYDARNKAQAGYRIRFFQAIEDGKRLPTQDAFTSPSSYVTPEVIGATVNFLISKHLMEQAGDVMMNANRYAAFKEIPSMDDFDVEFLDEALAMGVQQSYDDLSEPALQWVLENIPVTDEMRPVRDHIDSQLYGDRENEIGDASLSPHIARHPGQLRLSRYPTSPSQNGRASSEIDWDLEAPNSPQPHSNFPEGDSSNRDHTPSVFNSPEIIVRGLQDRLLFSPLQNLEPRRGPAEKIIGAAPDANHVPQEGTAAPPSTPNPRAAEPSLDLIWNDFVESGKKAKDYFSAPDVLDHQISGFPSNDIDSRKAQAMADKQRGELGQKLPEGRSGDQGTVSLSTSGRQTARGDSLGQHQPYFVPVDDGNSFEMHRNPHPQEYAAPAGMRPELFHPHADPKLRSRLRPLEMSPPPNSRPLPMDVRDEDWDLLVNLDDALEVEPENPPAKAPELTRPSMPPPSRVPMPTAPVLTDDEKRFMNLEDIQKDLEDSAESNRQGELEASGQAMWGEQWDPLSELAAHQEEQRRLKEKEGAEEEERVLSRAMEAQRAEHAELLRLVAHFEHNANIRHEGVLRERNTLRQLEAQAQQLTQGPLELQHLAALFYEEAQGRLRTQAQEEFELRQIAAETQEVAQLLAQDPRVQEEPQPQQEPARGPYHFAPFDANQVPDGLAEQYGEAAQAQFLGLTVEEYNEPNVAAAGLPPNEPMFPARPNSPAPEVQTPKHSRKIKLDLRRRFVGNTEGDGSNNVEDQAKDAADEDEDIVTSSSSRRRGGRRNIIMDSDDEAVAAPDLGASRMEVDQGLAPTRLAQYPHDHQSTSAADEVPAQINTRNGTAEEAAPQTPQPAAAAEASVPKQGGRKRGYCAAKPRPDPAFDFASGDVLDSDDEFGSLIVPTAEPDDDDYVLPTRISKGKNKRKKDGAKSAKETAVETAPKRQKKDPTPAAKASKAAPKWSTAASRKSAAASKMTAVNDSGAECAVEPTSVRPIPQQPGQVTQAASHPVAPVAPASSFVTPAQETTISGPTNPEAWNAPIVPPTEKNLGSHPHTGSMASTSAAMSPAQRAPIRPPPARVGPVASTAYTMSPAHTATANAHLTSSLGSNAPTRSPAEAISAFCPPTGPGATGSAIVPTASVAQATRPHDDAEASATSAASTARIATAASPPSKQQSSNAPFSSRAAPITPVRSMPAASSSSARASSPSSSGNKAGSRSLRGPGNIGGKKSGLSSSPYGPSVSHLDRPAQPSIGKSTFSQNKTGLLDTPTLARFSDRMGSSAPGSKNSGANVIPQVAYPKPESSGHAQTTASQKAREDFANVQAPEAAHQGQTNQVVNEGQALDSRGGSDQILDESSDPDGNQGNEQGRQAVVPASGDQSSEWMSHDSAGQEEPADVGMDSTADHEKNGGGSPTGPPPSSSSGASRSARKPALKKNPAAKLFIDRKKPAPVKNSAAPKAATSAQKEASLVEASELSAPGWTASEPE